jgi:hypothetical protein
MGVGCHGFGAQRDKRRAMLTRSTAVAGPRPRFRGNALAIELPPGRLRTALDVDELMQDDIVLEKVLPPGPVADVGVSCLAGKGPCPPEDCGGAWGYASLKEVLADPDHGEHEDLLDWLGLDSAAGFEPARFSLDEVNAGLSRLL